jgi:hypothetical protein
MVAGDGLSGHVAAKQIPGHRARFRVPASDHQDHLSASAGGTVTRWNLGDGRPVAVGAFRPMRLTDLSIARKVAVGGPRVGEVRPHDRMPGQGQRKIRMMDARTTATMANPARHVMAQFGFSPMKPGFCGCGSDVDMASSMPRNRRSARAESVPKESAVVRGREGTGVRACVASKA